MSIERLEKLMIDSAGFGYHQADDACPNDAVCEYSKARARENALLSALIAASSEIERLVDCMESLSPVRLTAFRKSNNRHIEVISQIMATR